MMTDKLKSILFVSYVLTNWVLLTAIYWVMYS